MPRFDICNQGVIAVAVPVTVYLIASIEEAELSKLSPELHHGCVIAGPDPMPLRGERVTTRKCIDQRSWARRRPNHAMRSSGAFLFRADTRVFLALSAQEPPRNTRPADRQD